MPFYDYRCPKCNREFDAYNEIYDKDKQLCDNCGEFMKTIIKTVPQIIMGDLREEGYNPGLGEFVKSKSHKKRLMKEKNVVER